MMEITPLHTVQKAAKVDSTQVSAPISSERVDQVTIGAGLEEAKKITSWVEMLKQMPDVITLPTGFEPGSSELNIVQVISQRIADEILPPSTQSP